ncbi:MAG TPA: DUF6494 family protein [Steroidobacter sp.]|nr:DUF6494 family protein [Steroidobacter sp.]
MNEETFNLSIRKFLKKAGVGSQREIEHAVEAARRSGAIADDASLPVRMTLEMPDLRLNVTFDGEIRLGGEADPD